MYMNTNLINLTHGNDTNPLLYIMTMKLYIQRDIQCLSRNDARLSVHTSSNIQVRGRLHQCDIIFVKDKDGSIVITHSQVVAITIQ